MKLNGSDGKGSSGQSRSLLYKQQLTAAYGQSTNGQSQGRGRSSPGPRGRRAVSTSSSSSSISSSSSTSLSSSNLGSSSQAAAGRAPLVNPARIPNNEELAEVQKELRNLRKDVGERLKLLKKQGLEDGQDLKASASDARKLSAAKAETGDTLPKKAVPKKYNKTKKRKIGSLESDDDSVSEKDPKDESGRPGNPTLGKIKISSKLKDKSQAGSSTPRLTSPHSHAQRADDFTLPQRYTLPVRPAPMPVVPSTYETIKVDEDFTKIKAPTNQVPISTFYTSIEPYFRPLTQEDVSWLEDRGDEISPFLIPPLGPFYLDTWIEEDRALAGLPPSLGFPADGTNGRAHELDPTPGVVDSTLTESDLVLEERFAGPLSERILSALLTEKVIGPSDVLSPATITPKSNEEGRAGWVGLSLGSARPNFEGMDLVDYEDRIKRELRYLGLIPAADDELDWSNRCDDEISTLLRHCQDLLRTQIRENDFRRARLTEAAKDRMAYQDYIGVVDELDRGVEFGFSRRLKAVKKGRKKERKEKAKEMSEGVGAAGAATGEVALPSLAPTAAETNSIPISPALVDAVERRQRFIEMLYPVFRESDQVFPHGGEEETVEPDGQGDLDMDNKPPQPLKPSPKGRFTGTPTYSIYQGIEDWVKRGS